MMGVRAASQDRFSGMSILQPWRIEEVCDYNTGMVYRQRNNDRNICKASPNPDSSLPARDCALLCRLLRYREWPVHPKPDVHRCLWNDRFVPLPVIPLPLA